MARPGVLNQPGKTVLLKTAEPLANRGNGSCKEPRRGFDAALFGAFDKSKAMFVRVFHVTHQIEIASGSGHGAWILTELCRPDLPPSAGRRVLPIAAD